jgi:hypothetical protein
MNRIAAAVTLGTLVAAVSAASCKGCHREDDVPPLPSATATPSLEPPTQIVVEEDAGDDAADAEDGDAKKGGPSISTLVACCRTLAQNAKSNPNPMVAGSMIQAAALCESYARQGDVSGVNSALRQFGMKCK